MNVLAHFNVFFFLPDTVLYIYMYIFILFASRSDSEGRENLASSVLARMNLLKVSVSEYFLSHFLKQEKNNRLYPFTFYNSNSFPYTRPKEKM